MAILAAICYTLACGCFLVAINRDKLQPSTLDFVAAGLFFLSVPWLVQQLAIVF